MITVKIGTVAWAEAIIHSPPLRMVPVISCSSPTAKPGLSTRLRIGRWKRSQTSMWRRSLSQPSAVSAPPFTCRLSEAMTPIGWPSKRTKPAIWSVPQSGPISKKQSLSAISRMARRMSKVVVRLRGMMVNSSSSRRSVGIVRRTSTGGAS